MSQLCYSIQEPHVVLIHVPTLTSRIVFNRLFQAERAGDRVMLFLEMAHSR
jgi:hypothetical protein